MSNQPLVSVGIPTYNRSESLKRSISSVINQTYTNLEIIISDNASTDETQKVCEKFCSLDSRVKYIRQPENFGAGNNFKFVLEQATGEYFMWLGDDDYISKDFILKCGSELINNSELILVSGTSRLFIERHDIYRETRQEDFGENNKFKRFYKYYKTVSDNSIFYSLIRRENLTKVSIKNNNALAQDWFMVASLLIQGKHKSLHDIYIYRKCRQDDTFLDLVKRLNLPDYQGKFPITFIMIGALQDLMSNKVYDELKIYERIYLALIISVSFTPYLIVKFFVNNTPQYLYSTFQFVYRFLASSLSYSFYGLRLPTKKRNKCL